MDESVRRWIWQKEWRELRNIQDRAIPTIIGSDHDIIIAAATAGGKTEAAFLPLLSRLITSNRVARGFNLLYVSPLKALINDQFDRLSELCEMIKVPVHRWHGDVSTAERKKARNKPNGILLITPESLEAVFVRRGSEVPDLFGALDSVVIDELHALLCTPRGMHLRSLLNRLEIAVGRPIRRIGLSATLGEPYIAGRFLREAAPEKVEILESESDGQELKVQLRGYVVGGLGGAGASSVDQSKSKGVGIAGSELSAEHNIATHLFGVLRGTQNLVFAGTRHKVELYADMLREMTEDARALNEFYPHHANLACDHREFIEQRLKRAEEPSTAVCTSTLELGIDIGVVESVAQIGPPFSVASMRQRLGRSGRQAGRPAIMRVYVQERMITENIDPLDALRLELVQAIAMIDLLVEGWCEPPPPEALHLSTLVHQILSVIAERGGATAATLFTILCERGPFSTVDRALFIEILRCLGARETDLIEQVSDGNLHLGVVGERLIEHFSFFAVFNTPEEYRVIADGRTLGTLPFSFPLLPNMPIIFSGRRWRVVEVHDLHRVINVTPDTAGHPPRFGGEGGDLHDHVVQAMSAVYQREDIPPYLDAVARDLLAEGRDAFRRFELDVRPFLLLEENRMLLFPWRGTVATRSLALALVREGLTASPHQVAIEVAGEYEKINGVLKVLSQQTAPDPIELAACVRNLVREKFHPYLNRSLQARDMASSEINSAPIPDLASRMIHR